MVWYLFSTWGENTGAWDRRTPYYVDRSRDGTCYVMARFAAPRNGNRPQLVFMTGRSKHEAIEAIREYCRRNSPLGKK